MSVKNNHLQSYLATAFAGAAVLGSMLIFRRLMKLEKSSSEFDRMMKILNEKTEEIKGHETL